MMEVKLLMLLPTKGIEPERALLTIGARIVSLLESPATITGLWERFWNAQGKIERTLGSVSTGLL